MRDFAIGAVGFVLTATTFGIGFFIGMEFGASWDHADFIFHMIALAH